MGQVIFEPLVENVSQLRVISRAGSDLVPNLHCLVITLVANQTANNRISSRAVLSLIQFSQTIPKSQTLIKPATFNQILRKCCTHLGQVSDGSLVRIKVVLVQLPGKIEQLGLEFPIGFARPLQLSKSFRVTVRTQQ